MRPNIVFILVDDLDTESGAWIDHFPKLRELLTEQGTTFENSFVSLALCCPSRASMLRGQYAHNTKIFGNSSPSGGFQKIHDLGLEDSTVATWLHDAGYRTILLGKYLNHYPGDLEREYVPPGWDEWYGTQKKGPEQFGHRLNENGRVVTYGHDPRDYLQDMLRTRAVDFIRESASAQNPQPFFMWMAPHAPHSPATPAPRHAGAFPDVQAPRVPTFNQADVSGYPGWLRDHPLLSDEQIAEIDVRYRRRLQSMLAVEDTVRDVVGVLRETGQLDNTYLIFSSDNGFHLGQHRLEPGKNTAFEEDLRVPLIVRGPGVPAGRVLPHMTVNVDLAPTFAELAGVPTPDFVDGRSLAPLLGPNPPPVGEWRHAFLLEHGYLPTGDTGQTPADALDTAEPPDSFDLASKGPPPFQGLHTSSLVYVEYATTGERELYDLDRDPYQQRNIAATADPTLLSQLAARLDLLRACQAGDCRSAEALPFPGD